MTPRAQPLPPSERRQRILDAVLPLLITHGRDLTTRQIAEAAGVAEGTLFRVFENKDALVAAVVEQAMDPSALVAELGRVDRSLDLPGRVAATMGVLRGQIRQVSQLMAALATWRVRCENRQRPAPEIERERADRVRDAVADVLRPDADRLALDLSTAAAYLRGVAFATAHPFFSDGSLDDPQVITDVLLHGLTRPAPAQENPC